jgi:hypothetical protein
VKQSDARAASRGRDDTTVRPAERGVLPASFGRTEAEGAVPGEAEEFTIRGGEAIHVMVHAHVTPDAASLEALRTAIRETTRQAVLEGYAAAFTDMDSPAPGDAAPPGT